MTIADVPAVPRMQPAKDLNVRWVPIQFKGHMVQAILAGTKTQTRRVLREQTSDPDFFVANHQTCPYGRPRRDPPDPVNLWVRERLARDGGGCWYYGADSCPLATPQDWYPRRDVVPSIFMPRWASRLTLRVTGVRVEQLRAISDDDAVAEGFPGGWVDFRTTWVAINGHRAGCSWIDNPWVWVVSFTRVQP